MKDREVDLLCPECGCDAVHYEGRSLKANIFGQARQFDRFRCVNCNHGWKVEVWERGS